MTPPHDNNRFRAALNWFLRLNILDAILGVGETLFYPVNFVMVVAVAAIAFVLINAKSVSAVFGLIIIVAFLCFTAIIIIICFKPQGGTPDKPSGVDRHDSGEGEEPH